MVLCNDLAGWAGGVGGDGREVQEGGDTQSNAELSPALLFKTPRTEAHQAPLAMEFFRQEILEWVD